MADYLVNGAVANALNMPSISAEDAPRLKPYMALAEQLGSFAGQITENAIKNVSVAYEGSVADLNTRPLTAVVLAHLLKAQTDTVNMVNAPAVAQARGITISETKTGSSKDFRSLITVTVETEKRTRTLGGTLFTGKQPRIINVEGVPIEAALAPSMLYIRNEDKPGLIGGVGTILAQAGQNIADFRLGRVAAGEQAVCLVSLDAPLPDDVFEKLSNLPQIRQVKRLAF
jgi:D-3-phosphoglycerate dehydrogenase